jgi:hypothetical protein
MHKVEYPGGWLELRDPADLTIKGRRQLLAIFTSVQGPMQRLEQAPGRERSLQPGTAAYRRRSRPDAAT